MISHISRVSAWWSRSQDLQNSGNFTVTRQDLTEAATELRLDHKDELMKQRQTASCWNMYEFRWTTGLPKHTIEAIMNFREFSSWYVLLSVAYSYIVT